MKAQQGQAVQMKTGGPDMTVHSPTLGKPGYYDCQWFANDILHTQSFPIEALLPLEGEFSEEESEHYKSPANCH